MYSTVPVVFQYGIAFSPVTDEPLIWDWFGGSSKLLFSSGPAQHTYVFMT